MKVLKLYKNQYTLVFVDQMIFSGSNFVLTFLLARLLDVSDFGIYTYILLTTYFLLSVVNAIIIQPFQILISKKPKAEVMGFALRLFILFFGAIVLLALAIYFTILKADFTFYKDLFFGALVFVLGYLFQDFFRKSLLGLSKIEWVLWMDILFLLVFCVLSKGALTLNETLLWIGFFNFVSGIPGLYFFLKNAKFTFHEDYKKYHIQNGKWLLKTAVLQWLSNNFLVFVSGIYLGLEALGALRLVQSFFGILNVILQTVENYFLPKVAHLYFRNTQRAQHYLSKLTQNGFLIFGTLLLSFFVFSDFIIVFLGGEKYKDFGYVIKLMTVLYICIFYSYPMRIKVRIFEMNKHFFFGYLLSAGFTLVSFHFLLKYGSLYGAIGGLVISQLIMMTYWRVQLNKKAPLKWT